MSHQVEQDRNVYPLVYVIQENVFGYLIQENAFFSKVRYSVGGMEYNTWLENDEFLIPDQIGYES